MKAEGGWAVVSTEETEIHPTSDISPYIEQRLWDDRDIPALRLMTEAVHEKGSLAAIELAHNGHHAANHTSRAPVLSVTDMSVDSAYPKQARAMDKTDIRNLRRWHRDAALRAKRAGFDIIYVYAGHRMSIPHFFMLPELNDRSDEYGGSLENRVRLTLELIEDTREAVGDTCAVAFRFAVDELMGADGMQATEEGRAVVELLAEMPDLWDVNVSNWGNDSITTRFQPEDGYQTPYIEFVKTVTTKPVVAVGRLSSPDLMLSMVKRGIVDFIGAARPSISDPFLPKKIEEGRIDEIRECIGCNICVLADNLSAPIRCTQNPTIGEEWRRGWHPEQIAKKGAEEKALVVGGGPAGLEAAMQLGRRGYQVTLAEAGDVLGGRVIREAALTGLSAWRRVADHRIHDLQQRANVALFLDSRLSAEQVLELDIPNVFIATGAWWRRDGVGRSSRRAVSIIDGSNIVTPDDVMAGQTLPPGPVVIYDDDQGYMAGILAEKLAEDGCDVCLITPASVASPFTDLTLEQKRVQRQLLERGVNLVTNHILQAVGDGMAKLMCIYSDRETTVAQASVLMVTERVRDCAMFDKLSGHSDLQMVELIGDAAAPGLIADAVYSGHMAARNFERDPDEIAQGWFKREMVALKDGQS